MPRPCWKVQAYDCGDSGCFVFTSPNYQDDKGSMLGRYHFVEHTMPFSDWFQCPEKTWRDVSPGPDLYPALPMPKAYMDIIVFANYDGGMDLWVHHVGKDKPGRYRVYHSKTVRRDAYWHMSENNLRFAGYYKEKTIYELETEKKTYELEADGDGHGYERDAQGLSRL